MQLSSNGDELHLLYINYFFLKDIYRKKEIRAYNRVGGEEDDVN
jgi:hypothetical protein